MAVEDKYVDANLAADKKSAAIATSGGEATVLIATEEIAAADDNGSKYRLFKAVPSNLVPIEISIECDAITGGTDYDLGLYEVGVGGAAVDADVLMDGQTLASALTKATGHQLGLQTVNAADAGKSLAELSGQTDPSTAYDIVLTANTVGTADGTVSVRAIFAQGK